MIKYYFFFSLSFLHTSSNFLPPSQEMNLLKEMCKYISSPALSISASSFVIVNNFSLGVLPGLLVFVSLTGGLVHGILEVLEPGVGSLVLGLLRLLLFLGL